MFYDFLDLNRMSVHQMFKLMAFCFIEKCILCKPFMSQCVSYVHVDMLVRNCGIHLC